MRSAVILFAKAPIPGRVKTRLTTRYPAESVAELHDAFVRDMIKMLRSLGGQTEVELHTDITTDDWDDINVARALQTGGNLGNRMLHAMDHALRAGYSRAMIVGSDAPTLPAAHLERLLAAGADVALGPADDGGYYAISCRRTHPGMFDGVEWSGPKALKDTIRAARACELTVELGEPWFDVDTPEDLARLARSPELPSHTEAWLLRHANALLESGGNR